MKVLRRSTLERKLDILKAVQGHAWKNSEYPITQLLHDVNMNWPPLQKLIGKMVECGLMNNSTRGTLKTFKHFYFLTEKGRQAIKLYNDLCSLIDEKPITAPEY